MEETILIDNSIIESHLVTIIDLLNNLVAGFQILLYIAVAFLLWKVITILYKLLAGVFLGGL